MAASPPRQEPDMPDLDGWGRSNRLWLTVSLSMVVLLGVAAWLVAFDTDQPLPPFLQAGGKNTDSTSPAVTPSEGLRLAGSGSNLPMARALSAAFPRDESHHPVVHASIGSGGGVRALLDGVIDIALVSRPLREHEREQGLVATPYARVPIVVAAHASVPIENIAQQDLVTLYEGGQRTWANGTRVVVLQRERGDSSHVGVSRVLPQFEVANEVAYREAHWRVLYRDDAMREALTDTRGAIGLFGQGKIPAGLPVHAIAVDGVMPSPATVDSGTYPFTKDFAFVTRGTPRGETAAFIEFAQSNTGQRIIYERGGLPLGGRRTAAEER